MKPFTVSKRDDGSFACTQVGASANEAVSISVHAAVAAYLIRFEPVIATFSDSKQEIIGVLGDSKGFRTATTLIQQGQVALAEVQDTFVNGSATWHFIEDADDIIHKALAALGN